MATPPFSTQFSILCGQLSDGSPVIIPVDASGNLPVSISNNAPVVAHSEWITYGALRAACTTKAAYDALDPAPTAIPLAGGVSGLRVSLANTTAAQSGALCVRHFASDGSLKDVVEVSIPTTDLVASWTRAVWNAPSGAEIKLKQDVVVLLRQHAESGDYATLTMSAVLGGAFYARVQVL